MDIFVFMVYNKRVDNKGVKIMKRINVIRKLPQHMEKHELEAISNVLKKANCSEPLLCKHAKERLAERGISHDSIKEIFKFCKIENVVETNVKNGILRLLLLSNKIYKDGDKYYRVGISINAKTLQVITVIRSDLNPHGIGIKNPGIDICSYLK